MSELKEVQIYGEFEAKIAEVKEACNFLPDVSTDEGYEKSKRVSLDVGKILTAVEAKRVEEKSESLAYGKKVDSEAKALVAKLVAFQIPHKEAYKELDSLNKEREQRLKDELEERVRVIRELPEAMRDSDSTGVKMALESLQVEECLDFYGLTQQALIARNASKIALSAMFSTKLQQEKDAVELAILRKKQTEQDQKDHDERIAKEASEKAERKAEEAKKAELAAVEAAAEAVRQREAAAVQAQIDIDKAAEKATQEQIRLQKEKEAAEAAEIARKEANKRHVGKIRGETKDCLIALGIDEAMAIKVVLAIHNKKIKNISINY